MGWARTLQVIKNGAVVDSISITSAPFTHEMSVEAPAEGEDRYRHQVMFGIEPQTIGSYVWLRAADETGESSSGCSCRIASTSDYDTGFLLAVFALGAWYWRRRRLS